MHQSLPGMATDQNGIKSSSTLALNSVSSLPTTVESITSSVSNSTASFPTLSSSEDEPTTSSSSLTTTGANEPPEAKKIPSSGHYSGRHPVPRIESFWELYPDRSSPRASQKPEDVDAQRKERKREVKEHSETVVDPITGKKSSLIISSLA